MKVRGMAVIAVRDEDGAVWFADVDGEGEEIFVCTVGDRRMHIDELAPPVCNTRTCMHGKVTDIHCAFTWCDNYRDACEFHKLPYFKWTVNP